MAEKIGKYRWRDEDSIEYVLTDIPTDECHECGDEIHDQQYCYFRDDESGIDHICWNCGQKITGFGVETP